MNIKKFCVVFVISTLVLLTAVLFAGYTYVSKMQIGDGGEIAVLEKEIQKNERKNVLVVGTDKSGVLADVIMIFSFSDEGDPLNVMSVQRDTEVYVGGRTIKINSVIQRGKEVFVQTVRDVTGIPLHDYVILNFKAVKDVVDLLGGVDFNVPQNMDYEDPEQDLYIHLRQGMQHLDGENALKLLRFRGYPMADIQRTKVQRDFIQEAFRQKANVGNLNKIEGIFNAISRNISSSLTVSEVIEYANMANGVVMETYSMPYVLTGTGTVLVDRQGMKTLAEEHFILEEKHITAAAE